MRRYKNRWFKKWTLKGSILGIGATFICTLGLVFAAQMGEFSFGGIARVHEYLKFPISPRFLPTGPGQVAIVNELAPGVEKLVSPEFDGEKVVIYLVKPPTAPSPDDATQWPGNPAVTIGLKNISTLTLDEGQIWVDSCSGAIWSCGGGNSPNISPSLSTTTVNSLSDFDVYLNFNSAISPNSTEHARIKISFNVYGEERTFEIDVYYVPNLTGRVTYSPLAGQWTNGDVTATLTASDDISTPAGWTKVSNRIYTKTYSANTAVAEVVTISNGTNTTTATGTVPITWIDTDKPTFVSQEIIRTGYTTLTVGVTGAQDTGGSGVAGCRYSVDNGVTWTPNNVACTNYQITGLEMETGYAVQFRVYDVAGNYAQSTGPSLATTLLLTGLPLAIAPNAQGYFFDLSKISNKLTDSAPLSSTWDGEYLTLVLMKPTATVNGNEDFAFTSTPITNVGDIQWTGGTISGSVSSAGINPVGNKTTLTISSTTVNSDATMTFTFNLNGKIDINDVDLALATITYKISGITPDPYFKVIFYYIPATGYSIIYDANDGSGRMPDSACASATAACAWNTPAGRETGLRANGFTPPAGKTTFAGWNTKADGTGTNFAANASIPAGTFTAKSINTLYAIWQ